MPLPTLPVLAAGLLTGVVAVVLPSSGPGAAGPVTTAAPAARTGGLPASTPPAQAAGALPGPATGAVRVPAPTEPWRWPVLTTPRVLRGFAPPPHRWQAGHRGVDLSAVPGDQVVAAGAGVVTFAGPLAGRGVVTVTHGGLRTTYEPVSAAVSVGDVLAAGDRIGTLASGASHCGGVPSCLHWGLLAGRVYLDPLSLLGRGRPVLLPIPDSPGVPPP